MSENERWISEFQRFHESAKETIGAFLYEPFGFETTDTMNGITLYVLIVAALFILYRVLAPAHMPRVRSAPDHYDFGRGL